jgi:CHAD domain-containing protein
VAYRLKAGESVSAGVKRIALEELGEAIECLRAGRRQSAVHETRKSLKKVRALLRLMKGEMGEAYGAENERLREIGRMLSPVRDADALIEAVDRIAGRRSALSAIRPVLVRCRRDVAKRARMGEMRPKMVAALEAARKGVRSWPLSGVGFDALEPGLEAAFRKGRKALARYRRTGLREDLHEWRKRVKDHWYHVRLLQDLWRDGIESYERSLKELEDALGEYLNLWMLREQAAQGTEEVTREIDEERKELGGRAMQIGERLYAEKPRRLVKRMRRLWG